MLRLNGSWADSSPGVKWYFLTLGPLQLLVFRWSVHLAALRYYLLSLSTWWLHPQPFHWDLLSPSFPHFMTSCVHMCICTFVYVTEYMWRSKKIGRSSLLWPPGKNSGHLAWGQGLWSVSPFAGPWLSFLTLCCFFLLAEALTLFDIYLIEFISWIMPVLHCPFPLAKPSFLGQASWYVKLIIVGVVSVSNTVVLLGVLSDNFLSSD